MKTKLVAVSIIILFNLFLQLNSGHAASHEPEVKADSRCPVCGMFVAKYVQWWTQLTISDGSVFTFDGVKDMMAYSFSPEKYGAKENTRVVGVFVKDYYTQEWFDGKKALFVTGSDVLGPMGHELIPFSNKAAAESFLKDHKGKEILTFSEITAQRIESMRQGHKMKKHTMKEKK